MTADACRRMASTRRVAERRGITATRTLFLSMAAMATLLILASPSESLASVADDARIIFAGERDSSGIFVIEADGSGESPITRRDPHGFGPAWSPDGSKIAFNGSSEMNLALWIMGRNGEDPRPVGFRGSP